MNYRILIILCLFIFCSTSYSQSNDEELSNGQIQAYIDNIRTQYRVPGIAVAMVEMGKPTQIFTSGVTNIQSNKTITEHTQFRFGSVAKILVAMSVMKLVEQGQLSLDSKVRDLAPEIAFANPWAAEHPLTVQHLLNHTTGWDGMHFAENVAQKHTPLSVRQVLELHPHSRESRWPPGSRFAYNNNGPLVAAYIVEKLSGTPYEAFVKQQFFAPLGMNSSDYFYTDSYREHAATLYVRQRPIAYEHINNRAAGGLNSSIADMAKLIAFLLSQGRDEHALLNEKSIALMQKPSGSSFTDAGLEFTNSQGLNLYHKNGWVLFGHEGSVRGAMVQLMYQPQLRKGFVIAMNSESPAIMKLHTLLADAITRSSAQANTDLSQPFSEHTQTLSGVYRVINPTSKLTTMFSQLMPWRLQVGENQATIGPLFGMKSRQLSALTEKQLAQAETGKTVLVIGNDTLAGEVIYYGPMTLQRVPAYSAYMPLLLMIIWLITSVCALLFALIWVPRMCLGKISNRESIRIRAWSLTPVVVFIATMILVFKAKSSAHLFELVGQPTWLSVSIFMLSIGFFIASLYAIFIWWRAVKSDIKPVLVYFCLICNVLTVGVACVLLVNGLIGVRLWA